MAHPSRGAVWFFRSLAIGASVAAAVHVTPIARASFWENAPLLLNSEFPIFATSGARRLAAAARHDAERAAKLAARGDLVLLAKAARRPEENVRRAALDAMVAIALADGVLRDALRDRQVAATLADLDDCDDNCLALWDAIGIDRPLDRASRIEVLVQFVDERIKPTAS